MTRRTKPPKQQKGSAMMLPSSQHPSLVSPPLPHFLLLPLCHPSPPPPLVMLAHRITLISALESSKVQSEKDLKEEERLGCQV